jgi:hypothetical protein
MELRYEFPMHATLPLAGDAAAIEFLKMLTDYGLSAAEAKGLVDAWRGYLFESPGTRLLLRMSSFDYDRLCPISVKPAPTEMVRLGLILTEFK